MKIKEVSQLTGLTKKTIRFYEAQELLTPEKTRRNGRDFREYSMEDVETLKHIATLRRARFSLEEIRQLQEMPEETPVIFAAYRQRLKQEQQEINAIAAVVDAIEETDLTSPEVLIQCMEGAASTMQLPQADIHPRFRYLDELEARLVKKKTTMTPQERKQHKVAARSAARYAAGSSRYTSGNSMADGIGNGFDISSAQKVAAYNLLMNDKD